MDAFRTRIKFHLMLMMISALFFVIMYHSREQNILDIIARLNVQESLSFGNEQLPKEPFFPTSYFSFFHDSNFIVWLASKESKEALDKALLLKWSIENTSFSKKSTSKAISMSLFLKWYFDTGPRKENFLTIILIEFILFQTFGFNDLKQIIEVKLQIFLNFLMNKCFIALVQSAFLDV